MESESRDWVMRCPCGRETSIWDMGGIRFKAAGNPRRLGHCSHCGGRFWGTVYRRGESPAVQPEAVATTAAAAGNTTSAPSDSRSPCLLWIDGVGTWLMYTTDTLAVGASSPGTPPRSDELRLLADLSRRHIVIQRDTESYLLEAHGPARVNDAAVAGRTTLKSGDVMRLGSGVELRFLKPSELANTARLEFVSGHRPRRRIDGVILMDQVCLLGPTPDCHIVCPDWTQTIVIYRRDGRLWCKRQDDLYVNGALTSGDAPVRDGTVISGPELRFRVEFSGADLG